MPSGSGRACQEGGDGVKMVYIKNGSRSEKSAPGICPEDILTPENSISLLGIQVK